MVSKKTKQLISECKELINEQNEPFQKKMKAKHPRLKDRVIGHGGQANTPPFTNKPSMKRSKSAPPIGEEVELDEAYDKLKRYGLGALAAIGLAGAGGAAYKMSKQGEAPVTQAQAEVDMTPYSTAYQTPEMEKDQQQDTDTGEQTQVTPNDQFLQIKNDYMNRVVPSLLGGVPHTREEMQNFIKELTRNSVEVFGLQSSQFGGRNVGEALAEMTLFNPDTGGFEMVAGVQNLNTFFNICSMLRMKAPDPEKVSERVIFMEASKLYLNSQEDPTTLNRLKNELGITQRSLLLQPVKLRENKKRILIKNIDNIRS